MTKNCNFSGKVEWIGIRQEKGNIKSLESSFAIEGLGLEGDKITKKSSKKRQVTLMQKEHISVILSLAQEEDQNKIQRGADLCKGINSSYHPDINPHPKPNLGNTTTEVITNKTITLIIEAAEAM